MKIHKFHINFFICQVVTELTMAMVCPFQLFSEEADTEYKVDFIANTSSGDFSPYLISALTGGRIIQANGVQADLYLGKGLSEEKKFSWGYGAEVIGGTYSGNSYMKWDKGIEGWINHDISSPNFRIQQLYGELRYQNVLMTLGMKEHTSYIVNQNLSSGDLIESGNAIPLPEVRIGLNDFIDMPFTDHWLQIDGCISYGPKIDDKFQRDLYNYYNYHIASGEIFTYKHLHFRSNPDKPLSITIGMQAASFFGGHSDYYSEGKLVRSLYFEKDFKSYINMIMPVFIPKETFVQGSSLGCWDFLASYQLKNQSEIRLYFQGPFEDGSGIARRNGFDGLWGFEYVVPFKNWLSGLVIEYIDFRNQSGPIHWQPNDTPGTQVTTVSTGNDKYYNNGFYNSYDNYGLSIGTPFILSPIYNTDGYPAFACNRANGFHIGISGNITDYLDYRLLGSYQRGLGEYSYPYQIPRTCFSLMAEGKYKISDRISLRLQLAFDKGSLRGDNFGTMLNFNYCGNFSKAGR